MKKEAIENLVMMLVCADSFILQDQTGSKPVGGEGGMIKHDLVTDGVVLHFKGHTVRVKFDVQETEE